jgi:hypothetical protein
MMTSAADRLAGLLRKFKVSEYEGEKEQNLCNIHFANGNIRITPSIVRIGRPTYARMLRCHFGTEGRILDAQQLGEEFGSL